MKVFKIFIIAVTLFLGGIQMNVAYAVDPTITDGGLNNEDPTITDGGIIEYAKLVNPLKNGGVNDIPTLVQKILDVVLTIGVPIIVIAIIYSGFKFIAAQGNPEKLKEAKQTLLYVLIGAAILLAAYAIAQAIVSTVTAIRG